MRSKTILHPYITYIGVLLLWMTICSCQGSSNVATRSVAADSLESKALPSSWQLVFSGDIMAHGPQIKAAHKGHGTYDFTACFDSIASHISNADLAIANLETTFGGKPYSGYPMFSTPSELGLALRSAGFDILGTSNNHSADRGKRGLIGTLDILDSLGLKHVGTYRNPIERAAASPLIYDLPNLRLAICAYTYDTNGLPVPSPTVVDHIDTTLIRRDIARADSLKADYKIVLIHWGEEYQKHPNATQKKLAQFMCSLGVDAIIGSHPHVVQSSEVIRDSITGHSSYVIYSLGNFISNQRAPAATRGGMLLTLTISQNEERQISSTPHYQWVFVNKRTPNGDAIYRLLPVDIKQDNIPDALPPDEIRDYIAFRKYYRNIPLYHNN